MARHLRRTGKVQENIVHCRSVANLITHRAVCLTLMFSEYKMHRCFAGSLTPEAEFEMSLLRPSILCACFRDIHTLRSTVRYWQDVTLTLDTGCETIGYRRELNSPNSLINQEHHTALVALFHCNAESF